MHSFQRNIEPLKKKEDFFKNKERRKDGRYTFDIPGVTLYLFVFLNPMTKQFNRKAKS
jgi:hypothetical protein